MGKKLLSAGEPTVERENEVGLNNSINALHAITERVISVGVGRITKETVERVAKSGASGVPKDKIDYFITRNFGGLKDLVQNVASLTCNPFVSAARGLPGAGDDSGEDANRVSANKGR